MSVQRIVTLLIRFYQTAASPYLGGRCRYVPTCSQYMEEAVAQFGAWKGLRMAIKRLLRCHPFGGHGWDPVKK